jgi:hypothetical protein
MRTRLFRTKVASMPYEFSTMKQKSLLCRKLDEQEPPKAPQDH